MHLYFQAQEPAGLLDRATTGILMRPGGGGRLLWVLLGSCSGLRLHPDWEVLTSWSPCECYNSLSGMQTRRVFCSGSSEPACGRKPATSQFCDCSAKEVIWRGRAPASDSSAAQSWDAAITAARLSNEVEEPAEHLSQRLFNNPAIANYTLSAAEQRAMWGMAGTGVQKVAGVFRRAAAVATVGAPAVPIWFWIVLIAAMATIVTCACLGPPRSRRGSVLSLSASGDREVPPESTLSGLFGGRLRCSAVLGTSGVLISLWVLYVVVAYGRESSNCQRAGEGMLIGLLTMSLAAVLECAALLNAPAVLARFDMYRGMLVLGAAANCCASVYIFVMGRRCPSTVLLWTSMLFAVVLLGLSSAMVVAAAGDFESDKETVYSPLEQHQQSQSRAMFGDAYNEPPVGMMAVQSSGMAPMPRVQQQPLDAMAKTRSDSQDEPVYFPGDGQSPMMQGNRPGRVVVHGGFYEAQDPNRGRGGVPRIQIGQQR